MRRRVGLITCIMLLAGVLAAGLLINSGQALAGAPPVNPPSPVPPTLLPDLRGTWTGPMCEARGSGYMNVTYTMKFTERGPNNLFRGWWTSKFSNGTSITILITAHLTPAGTLRITKAGFTMTAQLDYHQTTNTTTFPTGWQPVIVGTGQWLDDITPPDNSGTNFFIVKKTTP